MNLLNKYSSLSRKEIEKNTGFHKDKVIRILNLLLEKDIIGKTGTGRATKYIMRQIIIKSINYFEELKDGFSRNPLNMAEYI